jgi:hypothetical protein
MQVRAAGAARSPCRLSRRHGERACQAEPGGRFCPRVAGSEADLRQRSGGALSPLGIGDAERDQGCLDILARSLEVVTVALGSACLGNLAAY